MPTKLRAWRVEHREGQKVDLNTNRLSSRNSFQYLYVYRRHK